MSPRSVDALPRSVAQQRYDYSAIERTAAKYFWSICVRLDRSEELPLYDEYGVELPERPFTAIDSVSDSVYKFFARILGALWSKSLVELHFPVTSDMEDDSYFIGPPIHSLKLIQQTLKKLLDFFESADMQNYTRGTYYGSDPVSERASTNYAQSRSRLQDLFLLVRRTFFVLCNLIQLGTCANIPRVCRRLQERHRTALFQADFSEFCTQQDYIGLFKDLGKCILDENPRELEWTSEIKRYAPEFIKDAEMSFYAASSLIGSAHAESEAVDEKDAVEYFKRAANDRDFDLEFVARKMTDRKKYSDLVDIICYRILTLSNQSFRIAQDMRDLLTHNALQSLLNVLVDVWHSTSRDVDRQKPIVLRVIDEVNLKPVAETVANWALENRLNSVLKAFHVSRGHVLAFLASKNKYDHIFECFSVSQTPTESSKWAIETVTDPASALTLNERKRILRKALNCIASMSSHHASSRNQEKERIQELIHVTCDLC
jgi:hypothetical protein